MPGRIELGRELRDLADRERLAGRGAGALLLEEVALHVEQGSVAEALCRLRTPPTVHNYDW